MSLSLFPERAPPPRAPRRVRHLYDIERGDAGVVLPSGTQWALVLCGVHDAWQPVAAADWRRGRAACARCEHHEPADPPADHPAWSTP